MGSSPIGGPSAPATVININGGSPAAPQQGPYKIPPTEDRFASTKQPEKKPQTVLGKAKDFAKGFGEGVLGMFSLKSMAMAAGAVVMGVLMPWTIPLMVVGGVGINGYGMAKALKNGDYKEAGTKAFGLGISVVGARSFAKGSSGAAETGGTAAKPPADFISLENGKSLFKGNFQQVRTNFNSTMSRTWDGMKTIGNDIRGKNNYYDSIKTNKAGNNLQELKANPWQSTKNVLGAFFMGKKLDGASGEMPTTAIQAAAAPTGQHAPNVAEKLVEGVTSKPSSQN